VAAHDLREIRASSVSGSVLEGSVRKAGDRLRITGANSSMPPPGYHKWSEKFERSAADVFAVQDEIARDRRRRVLRGGALNERGGGALHRQPTAIET
jgi:TolB-like protein